METKSEFIDEKLVFEPLHIKKQWFKNDPEQERWIYDAGKSMPYFFVCPNCGKSEVSIEIKFSSDYSISPYSHRLPSFYKEEIVLFGGSGIAFRLIRCQHCNTLYYIGLGYREPNNGRDVFFLHTIFEIDEPIHKP